MKEQIWKYTLDPTNLDADSSITLHLPFDADVLYAVAQRNGIVVYILVRLETKDRLVPVRFYVYDTGQVILDRPPMRSLGVCSFFEGAEMMHVFVETESNGSDNDR